MKNELTQLKQRCEKDKNLGSFFDIANLDDAIKYLDENKKELARKSLEILISEIQSNIEAKDILKRKDTKEPIYFLEKIPEILEIQKSLIDIADDIYHEKLNRANLSEKLIEALNYKKATVDENFNEMVVEFSNLLTQDEINSLKTRMATSNEADKPNILRTLIDAITKNIPESEKLELNESMTNFVLEKYHRQLVLGAPETILGEEVKSWLEYDYSFHRYPIDLYKDSGKKQQQIYLERLVVDQIIRKKFYSNLPIHNLISEAANSRQTQPNTFLVNMDKTVQFNMNTNKSFLIAQELKENFKEIQQAEGAQHYPARLIAPKVSNCQIVIIKNNKGQYWMLHTQPDAFLFFSSPKRAYSDLQLFNTEKGLGIQPGDEIDVLVIERKGYFNRDALESFLPENVMISSVKKVKFDIASENYHVCFTPEEEKLNIISDEMAPKQSLSFDNVFFIDEQAKYEKKI